jgi:hypothetical protein
MENETKSKNEWLNRNYSDIEKQVVSKDLDHTKSITYY